jgi:putative ABC transport system substrate-binding protein
MRRREFIAGIGAAAWPLVAHAQQPERMRRIGVLTVAAESDPDAMRYVGALETGLEAAGWHKGRNLEITYRWGASNPELLDRYAKELVVPAPEVLMALGTAALVPLQKATTTIPLVFTSVSEPVAQGFAPSFAHPGGSVTGFSSFEPDIGSRWLQLIKEIAPSVTRVTVMFNPQISPYNTLWMRAIETAAPAFGVSVVHASVETEEDVRDVIAKLASKTGDGLIVPSDSWTYMQAAPIASLATSAGLPAVYSFARFVHEGGLVSYGIDLVEQIGKAASYVDRILRGEKAGELPIQGPTHYTLTINLKTAKTLGLTIPAYLLATADGVIE